MDTKKALAILSLGSAPIAICVMLSNLLANLGI